MRSEKASTNLSGDLLTRVKKLTLDELDRMDHVIRCVPWWEALLSHFLYGRRLLGGTWIQYDTGLCMPDLVWVRRERVNFNSTKFQLDNIVRTHVTCCGGVCGEVYDEYPFTRSFRAV